ncbi:MAG: formylglycine-generating enzyme family protein [Verrucomicrobiota bacterium]
MKVAGGRIEMEMVEVPGGEFVMGGSVEDKFVNSTELPRRCVRVASFGLGVFPVTEQQWAHFRGQGPVSALPAVGLSWLQASAFCDWLSEGREQAFRLPSEAEWEYACRAGTETAFSTGLQISPEEANYLYDERGRRVGAGQRLPVGSKPCNAWGLGDLHGNVCEWVADPWHPSYQGAPGTSAIWERGGRPGTRVLRGGAWDYLPRLLRSSWRDWARETTQRDSLGFRVAMDLS